MRYSQSLPWINILELRVIQTLGHFLTDHWHLNLTFFDADGSHIDIPEAQVFKTDNQLCCLTPDNGSIKSQCLNQACGFYSVLDYFSKNNNTKPACFRFSCHRGYEALAVPIFFHHTPLGAIVAGAYINSDDLELNASPKEVLISDISHDNQASAHSPLNPSFSVVPAEIMSQSPEALEIIHRHQDIASHKRPDEVTRQASIPQKPFAEIPDQFWLSSIPRISSTEKRSLSLILRHIALEILRYYMEIQKDSHTFPVVSQNLKTRYTYDNIIGKSQPMIALYQLLDKVIDSDATVLIQGENGTGKELIAKAIHYNSHRKNHRFIVQNCSAFNDNLLDSELFGHKKGAFTGAVSDKPGLFEVADGGTFFLDEIGDMSPALQVKLLRVLQEGTFIPVGDTNPKKVDVHIIAATNRDLKKMVEQNQFREDLYYRINVINIHIPPLRERKDDIPLLVEHFLQKHSKNDSQITKKLAKGCLQKLMAFSWPGNIRELENEIEKLVVMAGRETYIGLEQLSPRIRDPQIVDDSLLKDPLLSGLPDAIENLERQMIYEVLKRHQWNKTRAAQDLQISRRNLIRKVNKYQLDRRRRP